MQTVGELVDFLRTLPQNMEVRTSSAVPAKLRSKGVNGISGDMQSVLVCENCVVIFGQDGD
jgi:hypothetical protein